MANKYSFSFTEDGAFGHAVHLIKRNCPQGSLVLDLGCGYGIIAEPLRDAGFSYVGMDKDSDGLENLALRGFEVHEIDLSSIQEVPVVLEKTLGKREVGALVMLDVLEHLLEPQQVLVALSECSLSREALLVTSIPNVTHVDLASKLLAGRWDVTDTGLLDSTHLRFFSEPAASKLLTSAGWQEVDSFDVETARSDQFFPDDHPYLQRETPVGSFLEELRSMGDPYAQVYQFVRAHRRSSDVEKSRGPETSSSARNPQSITSTRASGPERPGEGQDVPLVSIVLTDGMTPRAVPSLLSSLQRQEGIESLGAEILYASPTPFSPPCAKQDGQATRDDALEVAQKLEARGTTSGPIQFRLRVNTRTDETKWTGKSSRLFNSLGQPRGRFVVMCNCDLEPPVNWLSALGQVAEHSPNVTWAMPWTMSTPSSPKDTGAGTLPALLPRGVPGLSYAPLACYCLPSGAIRNLELAETTNDAVGALQARILIARCTMLTGINMLSIGPTRFLDHIKAFGHDDLDQAIAILNSSCLLLPHEAFSALMSFQSMVDESQEMTTSLSSRACASEEISTKILEKLATTKSLLEDKIEELQAARQQGALLEEELSKLVAANELARKELEDLRNSTSWKITAPLRKLMGRLRASSKLRASDQGN